MPFKKTLRNLFDGAPLDTGVEIVFRIRMAWVLRKVQLFHLREYVKYYFADFVRKGGTPLAFKDNIFAVKKLRNWGVPPSRPLRTFSQQKFFNKG